MREYVAPDGVRWMVEVRTPGASNAMIVFHHPDDATSRRNRYAWHIWRGDEARNVTARLAPERVLESLSDADLAMLFRRSMPIQTEVPPPVPASAGAPAWGLGSMGF
jgi:hypothetical protein